MITGALLQQMRAATTRFLTDTCTIEARSTGRGEYGEPQQSDWGVVASGVACRVITQRAPAASSSSVGDRETIVDTYRLVCPTGTALTVDQRVTLTSTGAVYHVVDLVTARTDETDTQAVIVRAR
jgi:hypothetical protein